VTTARQREGDDEPILTLVPVVRRVVAARVRDAHVVEDLVQETVTRVMAARFRVADDALAPYAVATARNLVARYARSIGTARDKAHLLMATEEPEPPGERLLRDEDSKLLATALGQLSPAERDLLLAHELRGVSTRTLAEDERSTPGAVAARLNRTRAKLRVEFLLAREQTQVVDPRCRPVLRALSMGDRRRQRELDAAGHLLECELCSQISSELLQRRGRDSDDETLGAVVPVEEDADVVTARQKGRDVAVRAGFGATEATLLATAISEMARNVVKFALRGEVRVLPVSSGRCHGVTVVVRDVGPGIADLDLAMRDGYSTYEGLGLGLPGTRRLMDRFEVITEPGKGTTVTMTKWRSSDMRSKAAGGWSAVEGSDAT
jgi:serine/threonine-protein kinase RsbT